MKTDEQDPRIQKMIEAAARAEEEFDLDELEAHAEEQRRKRETS